MKNNKLIKPNAFLLKAINKNLINNVEIIDFSGLQSSHFKPSYWAKASFNGTLVYFAFSLEVFDIDDTDYLCSIFNKHIEEIGNIFSSKDVSGLVELVKSNISIDHLYQLNILSPLAWRYFDIIVLQDYIQELLYSNRNYSFEEIFIKSIEFFDKSEYLYKLN